MLKQEIERKFIINEIPDGLVPYEEKMIHQNYLSVVKDEEIRLRMEVEDGTKTYDITYKKGTGLVRDEFQFPIQEDLYKDLLAKIKEKSIKKFRRFYWLGDHELMIDKYLEMKDDLVVAEIEFVSEEAANFFEVPEWFGKEITYDKNFKNKNLWKKIQ